MFARDYWQVLVRWGGYYIDLLITLRASTLRASLIANRPKTATKPIFPGVNYHDAV